MERAAGARHQEEWPRHRCASSASRLVALEGGPSTLAERKQATESPSATVAVRQPRRTRYSLGYLRDPRAEPAPESGGRA